MTVGKTSFDCLEQANWNKELALKLYQNAEISKKYYNHMAADEIVFIAIEYVKKEEYVNRFFDRIAKKYGMEKYNELFKIAFPEFDNINDFYDYCYNMFQKYYPSTKLVEVVNKLNISYKHIETYARLSKLYNGKLVIDDMRYAKRYAHLQEKYPEYIKMIQFIYNNDDIDLITEYIKEKNIRLTPNRLNECIALCYPNLSKEEQDEKIIRKYNLYLKYAAKEKRKNRMDNLSKYQIELAIRMVLDYIDGDYKDLDDFIMKKQLRKQQFTELLSIVKYYDNALYQKYIEDKNNEKNLSEQIQIQEIKYIINLIADGIDGRSFKLVDYYDLTTMPIDYFFGYANAYWKKKILSSNEYSVALKFWKKYGNKLTISEDMVMKEKMEINCIKDKDGFPIPNTGYVVTDEDKVKILEIIREKGYPLYNSIYSELLYDYLENSKNIKRKIK